MRVSLRHAEFQRQKVRHHDFGAPCGEFTERDVIMSPKFIGVILLSRFLANKYGKKKVFIVCLTLTAFFTFLFYLPSPTDVGLLFVLNIMKSDTNKSEITADTDMKKE